MEQVTATWNTGREYTAQGQRIAAVTMVDGNTGLQTGVIQFSDVDRDLSGAFEVSHHIDSQAELRRAVMDKYDRGGYSDLPEDYVVRQALSKKAAKLPAYVRS